MNPDTLIDLFERAGEAVDGFLVSCEDDPPWAKPAVKEPDRSLIGTPYENRSSVTYSQEQEER